MDTNILENAIKSAWELWADKNVVYLSSDFSVKVEFKNTEKLKYSVTLESMYEYVPVSLELLNTLATILDCTEISESSEDFSPGCETCDWGSSYSIEFSCW